MISIKEKFPQFRGLAVISNDQKNGIVEINSKDYNNKWLVIFFWPKDFTLVCTTEIAEFGKLNKQFQERDAQIIGASIDSEYVHLAWRQQKEDLHNLPFPMYSDVTRDLSTKLGIIDKVAGVAQRATFIVDKEGVIRFSYVTDLTVGRNPQEVLRVLDALQTEELCPCNWQKGDTTINY